MAKRKGGMRRKSRAKLKRRVSERGRVSIRDYLQHLQVNDYVVLKINSSVHEGMFLPRFYGRTGMVTGKRGDCYRVTFMDGNKEKAVYVHPIHLQKMTYDRN